MQLCHRGLKLKYKYDIRNPNKNIKTTITVKITIKSYYIFYIVHNYISFSKYFQLH